MFRDLAKIALAGLTGAFVVAGYTTWRIWDQGGRDESRAADAIVVLGAAQYNGVPSPIFAARLAHAVDLYHGGIAPVLVVTGGKLPADRTTEAAAARDYALANGVPDEAILVEDAGRTTLESLRSVAGMLEDRGLRSAVFVSDRTHMLRVLKIARAEGIQAYGSPTTTSPSESSPIDRLRATIHEIGALGVYFVGGTGP
ncbi:MAG TPA: YdcF family protein [Candidatus Limnocylindrales bacterium]|nr:YdcF family protein [Candidatus Limnocylindrales bacterium]